MMLGNVEQLLKVTSITHEYREDDALNLSCPPHLVPETTHLSVKVNLHFFFNSRNGIFILCHIHKKTHI